MAVGAGHRGATYSVAKGVRFAGAAVGGFWAITIAYLYWLHVGEVAGPIAVLLALPTAVAAPVFAVILGSKTGIWFHATWLGASIAAWLVGNFATRSLGRALTDRPERRP